jgi:hypothetical protein
MQRAIDADGQLPLSAFVTTIQLFVRLSETICDRYSVFFSQ